MTSVILGQYMGHTISPVTFLSTAPSTLYIIYTNPGPFYNGELTLPILSCAGVSQLRYMISRRYYDSGR